MAGTSLARPSCPRRGRSFRYRFWRQRDDLAQVGDRQLAQPALPGAYDAIGQRLLLLDHDVDALLQRADADELAHLHVASLANPECPVGGLILDRRIPPSVDMDNVVGG